MVKFGGGGIAVGFLLGWGYSFLFVCIGVWLWVSVGGVDMRFDISFGI
jgi:hypothetical protein